ncbi:MAG: carboxypeptidase-like regulatory domain-containing protein [Candidatus Udaeobacter sp.]
MFTKSLQIGFIGLILCAATAWAGPSAIQGVVKDPKGHAIKGADVRIESRDGKKLLQTVKTDGSGRYVSNGLAAGVYRVTLVVNGAIKASITNTQTKADKPTQLNFDLKPASTQQASAAGKGAAGKSGKHMVWMPATTGSHVGGRWVEVNDNGNADAGALNTQRTSAEAFHRQQMQNTQGPNSLGMQGGVGGGTP